MPRCCGYYGEGNGRIFGAISCNGAEPNVTNCDHTSPQYNHQYDVGVQCQQGQSFFTCNIIQCIYMSYMTGGGASIISIYIG